MSIADAARGTEVPRGMVAARDGAWAFLGAAFLVFAASAAATVTWCMSMAAMGSVPMSGGWAVSMAWLPSCGRTRFDVAASFLGMWLVMMVAMMLPSLVPALHGYRLAVLQAGGTRLARATLSVGAGYFLVWALLGMVVFPAGVALATVAAQQPELARALPFAAGVVVLFAGAFQRTAWKAHHLPSAGG